MDVDNISQVSSHKSKYDKRLDSFKYLYNNTYKKEIYSKRLNTQYEKFYKWIDKKNWKILDMELTDNQDNISPISTHLVYSTPYDTNNPIFNTLKKDTTVRLNYNNDNFKYGLVTAIRQLNSLTPKNAK
jgi:hypothetical protein